MKSLYILSDSTAVGQFVALHKTWPALLSAHLDGRYIVQNVSRNGETSRQALERLVPDVLRYAPDVVYVQYGINDANHWQTDKGLPRVYDVEFQVNIESILLRCERFGAKTILGNNHTQSYNDRIDSAKAYAYYFVDHSRYSGDYLMPDGVHLNECGHWLYFETIAKVIP